MKRGTVYKKQLAGYVVKFLDVIKSEYSNLEVLHYDMY